MARFCAQSLKNPKEEGNARDTIIRALDTWDRLHHATHSLWNDLVEAAGLYPYLKMDHLSNAALIRREYHKSRYLSDIYFHAEQNDLSFRLLAGKSIVLSAPTSFGKSLLIDELVASGKYRNIVIIQPTLALLDETRKKLHKYRDKCKLLVSTTQTPSINSGNIFLFTAERVVEYTKFQAIDFFIIDEFYKLSLNRDDERALTLNHALYKLLKFTNRFYLLGPMVRSIPEIFRQKYKIEWVHTNYATVAVDEIQYYSGPEKDKAKRQDALFNLLVELKEPTLIYCSAPQKATNLAIDFIQFLSKKNPRIRSSLVTDANNDIVEWLEENVHPDWAIISALRCSTAFHHGALPRHLGSSIVDAFNQGSIRYLFCTSTLIEGVNTTAKNVVLFDKRKGLKPIDFFDYRNIAGRSGRMSIHYVGRVYKFYEEPQQMELDIDVPIITQTEAPLELLIQLDKKDLSAKSAQKLLFLSRLDQELINVIKSNSGLSVEGQLKIVEIIESNLRAYEGLLSWRSIPTYQQLLAVIDLAWQNLLRKGESKANVRTPAQLAVYTIRYAELKSIAALINTSLNDRYWIEQVPDRQERVNSVVFMILNISRHWFDYKLPTLLIAVSDLQRYVFSKNNLPPGDYTFFAAMLENTFLSKEFATLLDLDIPLSAIKKLESAFPRGIKADELVSNLKSINLQQYKLNAYELKKMSAVL